MCEHSNLRIHIDLVQEGFFFRTYWYEGYAYCTQCQRRSPVITHGDREYVVDWVQGLTLVFRDIYK